MNNKLLLQDLTDQLSETGKLKKKDAEDFVKAFFNVIEESLFEGEVIKIQGFGTFKLLKVDSRKSVDVSTGKEFEIKEHYKASFTPDSSLKELVNKPFSHLEPVELISSSGQSKPQEEETKTQPVKDNKSMRKIEPDQSAENDKPQRTMRNSQEEEPMTQNKYNAGSSKSNFNDDIKKPVQGTRRVTPQSHERPRSGRGNPFLIIFLLIVAGLAIWAFLSNRSAMKESERRLNEIQMFDSTVYEDVKPEEFKPVIEDSLKLEEEIAAQVESLSVTDKSNATQKAVAKQPVKPALTKSLNKPVSTLKESVKPKTSASGVKYPVYITMGKGDMLTQIALKYYGHKAFWVYIYLANKNVIADPDHIQLGTKIRVPQPDSSKINANDPDCIDRAKALQTKILSLR